MQLTMIMNTTGHHPHLIAEAIGSALAQTNQDFKLMINCIHPDGLHLDRDYPNIIINNIEPFDKYPEQIAWGIRQVDTPYWCVLDSDDYILPWHIADLLNGIARCQKLDGLVKHHAVGCDTYWKLQDGDATMGRSGGWWRFAFTKLDDAWLTTTSKNFATSYDYDSFIFKRTECKIKFLTRPSYVYRFGESWHISKRGVMPSFEKLSVITPKVNNDILLLRN